MRKYLYSANAVSTNSTVKEIQEASSSLGIAKGLYYALNSLKLLSDGNTVREDIDRIDSKLSYLIEEKKKASQRTAIRARRKGK